MKEGSLRTEIVVTMERIEKDKERLKELAFMVWERENGRLMGGIPVERQGYKKVLRALGYVI